MYFRYSSCQYSFMEVSNSEVFLTPQKDPSSVEFNFLVTPSLHDDDHQSDEDGIASSQDSSDKKSILIQEQDQENQEVGCKSLLSSKLGSSQEFKKLQVQEEAEEVDDGFKTPTSSENKIQALLRCPPAPKKPKSLPLSERKCPALRRVLLDLSNEIESLFPPVVRKDLIGGKITKVRKEFDKKL